MYLNLYNALLDRKKYATSVASNIKSLQDKSQSNKASQSVRVVVGGTDKVVVFSIGQTLVTPMGKGEIIAIDKNERKLTFQLAFGTMFSNFANAMHWSLSEDRLDIIRLNHIWETKAKRMISTDQEAYKEMLELLGSRYEDSEATDNDDDSSEMSENSASADEESVEGKEAQDMDDGNESVESKQSSNVKAALSALASLESNDNINFFPLPNKQNSKVTRATIKAALEETEKGILRCSKSSILPIALAPISELLLLTFDVKFTNFAVFVLIDALQSFVKKFKEPTSLHLDSDGGLLIDLDALDTNKIPSCPLGSTGSLGWNGDLNSLKRYPI